MAANGFAHSAAPVRRVQEVQFGILSPDEIVRSWDMRVLEICGELRLGAESILGRKNRVSGGDGRVRAASKARWANGPAHGHHRPQFQVRDVR